MNGPVLRPAGTYRVTPGYQAVRDAILRHARREGIREALSIMLGRFL